LVRLSDVQGVVVVAALPLSSHQKRSPLPLGGVRSPAVRGIDERVGVVERTIREVIGLRREAEQLRELLELRIGGIARGRRGGEDLAPPAEGEGAADQGGYLPAAG